MRSKRALDPLVLAALLLPSVLADNSFPALTSSSASSTSSSASAAATTTGSVTASTTNSFPPISTTQPYPTASVPPTAMAPFMQKSTLPNNFVFICVGAIIGFFFVVVLVWRGLTAWSVKRNMSRANDPYAARRQSLGKLQKMGGEGGALLRKPQAPFYSHGPGSELSLDPLTGGANKSGVYSQTNRSSLFFSPTAGVGAPNTSPGAPNRASSYLPAGYYAAGKSASGGGVAGDGRPISMADFTGAAPQNQGYSRALSTGPSPDPSPMLSPMQEPHPPYGRSSAARMSVASLGARSDGRAPSAYLDDLFDVPPVPERGDRDRRF